MDDTDQAPPPTQDGPRVSGEQVRDLHRLQRSATDRKVAGVAGGLGRHLDVDPTLIRVLVVVMCFFGGAGFVLYAALWLLVPDERTGRAALSAGDEAQKVLLVAAAVIAGLLVLGHGWAGFGAGWPLGLLALGFVVWLVLRDRRVERRRDRQPVETAGQDRAAWSLPPYVAPPPRPRGRRTLLFWPTFGVVVVSVGCLAGLASSGTDVPPTAYPALALAIIGAALVIGAFRGRPGGLTFFGVVVAVVLGIGSLTGGYAGGQRIALAPHSADAVRSSYTLTNGDLTLDLTGVGDTAGLDGRDITITGGAGHVEVLVPDDVNVDVDARIRVVGGYQIGEAYGGGVGAETDVNVAGTPGSPTLHLDVDLRVGQIDVRQR